MSDLIKSMQKMYITMHDNPLLFEDLCRKDNMTDDQIEDLREKLENLFGSKGS